MNFIKCKFLLSGPTNVGKSTFVFELLKHADGAFTKPINTIYFCYSVDQPLYAEMKKAIPHITFFERSPQENGFRDVAYATARR